MGAPYAEVIGDPIRHSKSPLIHEFWLRKAGAEGSYRACAVPSENIGTYFANRRHDPDWRGCNVTMPLKQLVLDQADGLDEDAQRAAASNCILKLPDGLIATNTDSWALRTAAPGTARFAKRPIALIGSGGAARAVLATAADLGADKVTILARNPARADAIARAHGLDPSSLPLHGLREFPEAGLLINASPIGMRGQPDFPKALLSTLELFPADATVFDMVYAPAETSLLKVARQFGLDSVSGLEMLVAQARRSFELFFGTRPLIEHDAELMELLLS